MGDEVQAIKAGLLEVADIVVVNKGDRPGAQRTASQLRAMLGRRPARGIARLPSAEVLVTTAATGAGVPGAARGARSPAGRWRPEPATAAARLARAEAQVRARLADRIGRRLG